MTMLVSLEQAKIHLRIDTDAGDSDLSLKIRAASSAVLRHIDADTVELDSSDEPATDSAGDPIDVPADIQAAVLLLVGDLNRNRDGDNTAEWEHGFLPISVRTLLYPFRTPTLA